MTRDEILAMEPGRELDMLICREVMYPEEKEKFIMNKPVWCAEFSTRIDAAWGVVEKMNGEFAFEVGRAGDRYGRRWTSRFGMLSEWAEADTAPEAICKAALLAVMDS